MNTNESIDTLFKTLEVTLGNEGAKEIVMQILLLVVNDLEEEGLVVSQENIAPRISKYTSDFNEVSRVHFG